MVVVEEEPTKEEVDEEVEDEVEDDDEDDDDDDDDGMTFTVPSHTSQETLELDGSAQVRHLWTLSYLSVYLQGMMMASLARASRAEGRRRVEKQCKSWE
mmetsp:Transcript_12656/g.46253  ORF Transcript_12656/g.46253 Transcript_12656/m.46253 type:complete len:99 (-) Transcript_12656:542-838(-)